MQTKQAMTKRTKSIYMKILEVLPHNELYSTHTHTHTQTTTIPTLCLTIPKPPFSEKELSPRGMGHSDMQQVEQKSKSHSAQCL